MLFNLVFSSHQRSKKAQKLIKSNLIKAKILGRITTEKIFRLITLKKVFKMNRGMNVHYI